MWQSRWTCVCRALHVHEGQTCFQCGVDRDDMEVYVALDPDWQRWQPECVADDTVTRIREIISGKIPHLPVKVSETPAPPARQESGGTPKGQRPRPVPREPPPSRKSSSRGRESTYKSRKCTSMPAPPANPTDSTLELPQGDPMPSHVCTDCSIEFDTKKAFKAHSATKSNLSVVF